MACAGEGGNEGSYEMEEHVSTLQAEPRGSTHQDERAAHQEDSGQDGRSEERFNAVASTAAADGRQRAQHCEADPQPSRCCCLPQSLYFRFNVTFTGCATLLVLRLLLSNDII